MKNVTDELFGHTGICLAGRIWPAGTDGDCSRFFIFGSWLKFFNLACASPALGLKRHTLPNGITAPSASAGRRLTNVHAANQGATLPNGLESTIVQPAYTSVGTCRNNDSSKCHLRKLLPSTHHFGG